VLGLACAFVLALGVSLGSGATAMAAPGEGCANETLRAESNVNSTTGAPFSQGLGECRAYEKVSPAEKQDHDAGLLASQSPLAASGEAASFFSVGNFADPEGSQGGAGAYAARRTAASWLTRSTIAPMRLIPSVNTFTNNLDYGADVLSVLACGQAAESQQQATNNVSVSTACALGMPDGSWTSTPGYAPTPESSLIFPSGAVNVGASSDLSHVVLAGSNTRLLPGDTGTETLYEVAGLGTGSPQLRIVNLDSEGHLIGPSTPPKIGGPSDRYQAVSADGRTIFFTATPAGGVATIYARIDASRTVTISDPSPSECTACDHESQAASYQGAAADGSTAYFLTAQQLVDGDLDTTTDLYAYDLNAPAGRRIVQVSAGGAGDASPGVGADVLGVVRPSADGSAVSFVAHGVLTTVPNGVGEAASLGADNLYVVDRTTGRTTFVAVLSPDDASLWASFGDEREAQMTPEGRYLVFTTTSQLVSSDTDSVADVYRYDSFTGELQKLSPGNAELPATITPLSSGTRGANADINALGRAISADGSYVIFTTPEKLAADDVNEGADPSCAAVLTATGCDLYAWHDGSVGMISDGRDPLGVNGFYKALGILRGSSSISASGRDIVFTTHSSLVGQDTDGLADVYDARIGGGFPAPPPPPPVCDGEACRGAATSVPASPTPGSAAFVGPGNPPAPVPTRPKHPKKKHQQPQPKKHHKTRNQKKRRHAKRSRAADRRTIHANRGGSK
jgi:Tol biopolymer transport system component